MLSLFTNGSVIDSGAAATLTVTGGGRVAVTVVALATWLLL